jgi:hypothetical protein
MEIEVTEGEKATLAALVKAWNSFLELPHEHGDEINEFRHGVHALQDKILSRAARRSLKLQQARQI